MWRPLADPDLERLAWGALRRIDRLLRAEGDAGPPNPSLASGEAGIALFLAYLDAARPSDETADRALARLERSVEGIAAGETLPGLYGGFPGVGWVTEHLRRERYGGGEDLAADIDEGVAAVVASGGPAPPFELVAGLAGWGTYLLERFPGARAAELLPGVLDRLERTAERSEDGASWFTSPDGLAPAAREKTPAGRHDLGVAHGVPGVIGFLAAARRAGVDDPRVPILAEGAIRWLLGRKLPPNEISVFPRSLAAGRAPAPARTAWCYGDLGIAAVLLSAARAFGRPDWEDEAVALARKAARRPDEVTRTVEPSLCHGWAGRGHLLNRLYQATGEPELREEALRAYRLAAERSIVSNDPRSGDLGLTGQSGPESGRSGSGFLHGAAGVGLALLGAVTAIEPAWDRVMLVALPPAERPNGG